MKDINNEREQMMAMFRYSIISPLLNPNDSRTLKDRLQEQAAKVWLLPDGFTQKTYSWMTLEEWYYLYKKHGLCALVRQARKDRGRFHKISEVLKQHIEEALEKYPTLKSGNLIAFLKAKEELKDENFPATSTLYRYLRTVREKQSRPKQQRMAFEAPHPNDLWQTDIMYGPHVPQRQKNGRIRNVQSYCLGIIDDHTRRIIHAEFFLDQGIERYMQCLKKSFIKCGVPVRIYCDNGQVFRSQQIQRIAAEVGTSISHTKVRDAAAKGKIERFFRTLRDQFINGKLLTDKAKNIDDLNLRFARYLHDYNNSVHSSTKQTPMSRWMIGSQHVRSLPAHANLDDIFLLEAERCVKKDGSFSIHAKTFETDWTLAGKKIQVRYSETDLTKVQVYCEGEFIGTSRQLDRHINNGLPRQA